MRTITYDPGDTRRDPEPGDVLMPISRVTQHPTGTLYLICTARPVARRSRAAAGPRWALGVERIEAATGAYIWPLFWHRR